MRLVSYLVSHVHGDMWRGEFSEVSSQLNALPSFKKEHVKQIVTTWSHIIYKLCLHDTVKIYQDFDPRLYFAVCVCGLDTRFGSGLQAR